jgi:hypothetical protein
MALSNTSKILIAIKKLVGKAHTSNDKDLANEGLPSGLTVSSNTVFGEAIPTTANQTSDALYTILTGSGIAGNGQVEYLRFPASFILGTDTSSGRHSFELKLPADYEANSKNPLAGTYPYKNNQSINITSGSLQLVPPSYAAGFEAKPFSGGNTTKDNGTQIPVLDARDWNLDYFNGILFQQDPPGTGDHADNPDYVQGYLYIGKYLNNVVSEAATAATPAGSDTQVQFNDNGSFGASSAFTFDDTEIGLHAASPTIAIRRTNNNQDSDINFKGAGGVIGARLRFSGSASNDLILSTFTGATVKERIRIGSNLADVFVDVTGSLRSNLGISGSLTQLTDGTSYLKAGTNVTITSESNGSVTIAADSSNSNGNLVFNEYVGQANGTNTLFTLNYTPTTAKNVSVFVNGLLQMPATSITSAPFQDYSVTGSNVFFVSGSLPNVGSIIMANYTTNDAI